MSDPELKYEPTRNSLGALKNPARSEVVRIVTTDNEKIVNLNVRRKWGGQQQKQHVFVAADRGGTKTGRPTAAVPVRAAVVARALGMLGGRNGKR